ncbi:MGDG synthase family glycosyltransferase [Brevibacillus massiliensis]|jgi:processive 1,2-diacylglycerol beta-glucosyltransferase|uniref:MGDG synthase family glycosyltransferase n=1 Tax=Brevibacillus massiliensis TaxID=1118054 RepID=UPI0002D64956|nr:glycosyltransferase [Brevibacillus massiliensis]
MISKKVLILSEAFGAGHTKTAEALEEGISLFDPSVHTKIVELGQELNPLTTALMFYFYVKLITTYPSLWGKTYQKRQNQPISKIYQFMIYQLFHRKIEALLEHEKPNLVICTHPFSSSSVSRVKRLGRPFNLCTVITDFHAHGVYVHPEVDLYLVSSDRVQQELINMGIQRNRIIISGIPTKTKFWTKNNMQEIRRKLQLKDMPTAMLMGGGLGLGGIGQVAHMLAKWREDLQLVICTGHNKTLKRSLLKNRSFHHPHIHILEFVDIIDEWMDASDLIITKPGGVTCFEALLKGVPMLLYKPIPGHEEKNCDFLVQNRFAIKVGSLNEMEAWIQKWLCSPREVELLQKRIMDFKQNIDPLESYRSILKLLVP